MADAAIGAAIDNLSVLAKQEIILQIKVGQDIKNLSEKLEWLQTLLKDADRQRRATKSEYITIWVNHTRETAFEIQDVLDEFYGKVEMARFEGFSWMAILQFKWAADCFTRLSVGHQLSSKIVTINDKLESLNNTIKDNQINIHRSALCWAPSFEKIPADWGVDEPVGMEWKIQQLKEELLGGGNKRNVVSIISDADRKSLLAKEVYNNTEVRTHFEIVVWKNLPAKFEFSKILHDFCSKVVEQEDREIEDSMQEDIVIKAKCLLEKKRYLIFLNGISSLGDWKDASNFLPDKNNGSRILLIPKTESETAKFCESEGITPFPFFDLPLHGYESLDLFVGRFSDKNFLPRALGEYIKRINSITGGIPLFVVLLAGLLRSKNVSDWKVVYEYLDQAGSKDDSFDRMLSLTFDDLPHQLQSCCLYFAAQPQCTGFEANQLVRIWIAEGFIKPVSGKTLDEVGEAYLNELIIRSLVNIEEKDEFGCPAVVAVHDKIHAFLRSEAHKSTFVEVHDNTDLVRPEKLRRLFIRNYTHTFVRLDNSFPILRSFLCDCRVEHFQHSKPHTMKFLLESKFLRVLDLHGLVIKKLPDRIGNLIHLRYLGIRYAGFQKLPSSIGKLLNLQTLDIRKSSVIELTESFWRIKTLRHVLAESVKIPKQIGKLVNLQTLQCADCRNWNHITHEFLERMRNIRILDLEGLSTPQAESISKSLSNLEFVKHLKLKVREGHSIPSGIFSTPSLRCLQSMVLHGRLDNSKEEEVHGARYNLPNLTSLTLVKSNLSQLYIDTLSQLPSLTRLCLHKSYNSETLEFLPHEFQKLQELELNGLDKLVEWKLAANALPRVRKLILHGCEELRCLPEGLQELELEEVIVYNMKGLIESIRERRGDYEKIKHARIINTRLQKWTISIHNCCQRAPVEETYFTTAAE